MSVNVNSPLDFYRMARPAHAVQSLLLARKLKHAMVQVFSFLREEPLFGEMGHDGCSFLLVAPTS
jgi:hypothetical protein